MSKHRDLNVIFTPNPNVFLEVMPYQLADV